MNSPGNPNPFASGSSGNLGELSPGQKVGGGRFTLVRFLGRGGMGVVWLAQDERLDEAVALKFLSPALANQPDALDAMRRETRKSRRLSHPNIIRIHDLFEGAGEAPFISLEFVEGAALSTGKAQQANGLFPWPALLPLVRQLCEALDYAHAQKVIHRDLKPANMMVTAEGVLKLADFGIAATLNDAQSQMSHEAGNSGSPAYMSPQQMKGATPSVADDIYSLGATLYELLTSRPPFFGGDLYTQVQHQAAPPLADRLRELGLHNDIPPDVAAMVLACLAKDPAQRPASARAIAEWIGLTLAARPAPVLGGVRRRTLAMACGIGILVLGALLWPKGPRTSKYDKVRPLEKDWVALFAGRPLKAWTDKPGEWAESTDGTLIGVAGKNGTLRTTEFYTNFVFSVDAKLNRGAAGAISLRDRKVKKKEREGYAVILANTHKGHRKTGSLVGFKDLLESPVRDDEWFLLEVVVAGKRLVVRVNEKTVVDVVDQANSSRYGAIGLGHGGPLMLYRSPRVKVLPADEKEAWAEATRTLSGLD